MNPNIKKLAKICGMFGSDHMGERAAAAAQAEVIRKSLGLSWAEIFSSAPSTSSTDSFDPLSMPPGMLGGAFENILSPWERDFLQSLAGRTHYSTKQNTSLNRIRTKCSDWWKGQEAGRHAA